MKEFHIYKDIRQRTNGEIYLGVVGPVRTGKSTFIRRFMEEMVIPHMEDGPAKTRSKDELPQAASGKNIMTTEPKFIPTEAAKIFLEDKTEMKIRLIDCVGFQKKKKSVLYIHHGLIMIFHFHRRQSLARER